MWCCAQSFAGDLRSITREHARMKCYALGLGLDTFRMVALTQNFRRLDILVLISAFKRCARALGACQLSSALLAHRVLHVLLKPLPAQTSVAGSQPTPRAKKVRAPPATAFCGWRCHTDVLAPRPRDGTPVPHVEDQGSSMWTATSSGDQDACLRLVCSLTGVL